MRYIYFALIILGLLFAACQSTDVLECDPTVTTCGTSQTENQTDNTSLSENSSDFKSEIKTPVKPNVIATFKEGDLIRLRSDIAVDPDGDPLRFTYSAPLDANGQWQTELGDAGVYEVTITASDGVLTTVRTVVFEVLSVNKQPIITNFENIVVDEGDRIILTPRVTDPDGDAVELTFEGWMTSDTYQTTYDDAGEYKVTLLASDGKSVSTKTITITVNNVNRAPTLLALSDVTVTEGEIVEVRAQASDPDGDELTITYAKPLSEDGTWQTEIGDAGEYDITVSATDGEFSASRNMRIIVKTLNMPPVITLSNVVVKETELVQLTPVIEDPNGDDVTVTFSGWMTSATKQTDFGDAGVYNVTVTASDGREFTSKTITVTVEKVNRPPVFVNDDWFK